MKLFIDLVIIEIVNGKYKRSGHKVIYVQKKTNKFHITFDDGLKINDTQAARH